jgi:hypothetical protein
MRLIKQHSLRIKSRVNTEKKSNVPEAGKVGKARVSAREVRMVMMEDFILDERVIFDRWTRWLLESERCETQMRKDE